MNHTFTFFKEDKKITSCVLKFEVTDDDIDPNGAPFTFDIVAGDTEGMFQANKEGNLCIVGDLNRQVTSNYDLVVRVFDNGTPAMYSDVEVKIEVIEESTYSPEVSNLEISISSYLDKFPGGVIGILHAIDGDKFDTLTYEVVSSNRNLFDIDKKDGRILAFEGLDSGDYHINVSVTDGKYTSYGTANVQVFTITEEMIENSITIQFQGMKSEDFVKMYKKDFVRVLKREFNVNPSNVEVISIQKSQNPSESNRSKRDTESQNLDVLFAVNKGEEYIPRDRLKRKVTKLLPELESTMSIKVLKVYSDICEKDMCEGGQCVGLIEFDQNSLVPVMMDGGSFVSAKHSYTYECECPNGYVGKKSADRFICVNVM